ncbi:MAG: PTS galactitol transporter subunit IIC [Acholeplasmataceae bacterium]|nr:PTS galactitol transporter subunit IIC [Acholeplasmataceae bacterium]
MNLDTFLQSVSTVFNTFGSAIVVPLIIIVICLAFGVETKKAITAGLNAGIGLVGFGWVINSFSPVIVPAINAFVNSTGLDLPVVDLGWQAVSVIAYATRAGMIFLVFGLLFQILLYVTKFTNVFIPGDLWNNYSYMFWGSMVYVISNNMWLAIACMFIQVLYNVIFIEMLSKRWSTYYGYPNCVIPALHIAPGTPFAVVGNWLLNKLGAYKIRWSPENLRKKLGFIGEPTFLGLFLGFAIGILGHLKDLGTLSAWGNILTIALSTAAIMAIFPRVANIFSSAFMPLTEAARKRTTKNVKQGDEIYIGINDATGYGEPATLISGILLIPIMIFLCVVLPGNKVLLLADLIAIGYIIQPFVATTNGNIFKTIILAAIWFSVGLYVCTVTAPMFTQVYSQFISEPLAEGIMVTSGMIANKPIAGGLIFLPIVKWGWTAVGVLVAVYIPLYLIWKKNKKKVHEFMEKQAALDIEASK